MPDENGDRTPDGPGAIGIGAGVAIGAGLGAALFAATDNPVWIGVFTAIGAALGWIQQSDER